MQSNGLLLNQEIIKKFEEVRLTRINISLNSLNQEKSILNRINRLKPDFLIVNMGSPKQELWLAKNLPQLKIKVGWCVGGLFNYIAGIVPSCPKYFGDLGFEWLFRLAVEPKRLWKRYLIEGPKFILMILKLK